MSFSGISLYVLSFFVLTMSSVFAVHLKVEDLKFNYIQTNHTQSTFDKEALMGSVLHHLGDTQFSRVELGGPLMIDVSFSSIDYKKVVFVKYGYDVDDESFKNKLVTLSEGFLFHSKTPSGAPYALFIKGFDEYSVRNLLNSVKYSFHESTSYKVRSLWQNLLHEAHAKEACEESVIQDWLKWTGSYVKTEAQKALGCVVGVFKGVWDSTGGLVAGTVKTLAHPVVAAKKVWSRANKLWEAINAFRKDFLGMVKKTYKNLSAIPPETLAEMECRILSALGTGAIVTYFTLGAGGPAFLLKLSQLIAQLENIPRFTAVLAPLSASTHLASFSVKRALQLKTKADMVEASRITFGPETMRQPSKVLAKLISLKLASTGKIRFFKNRVEIPAHEMVLTPGKSYVVVFHKGKLNIGEDYVNSIGTHSQTHPMIMDDIHWGHNSYEGKAGSFRLLEDGSINVSGQHMEKASAASANLLSTQFKEALPGIQVRSIPGRLSELDK